MGTHARFAVWRRVGRLFVVRPPGWPRGAELSFTDREALIEWAKGAKVMLRDGNPPREAR